MIEEKYITEIKRLRCQMVAVATRYLDNTDEAEDVTQDALLKLWTMHEMLTERDIERLAFTILKHLCIDELRRRECRKGHQVVGIDSIDVVAETENPQEIEERERQLMMAVDKLPSKHRLLLQLRYLKGHDVRTIAEITGSTEDSINMTLSRARNKVYKYLSAVVVAIVCLGLFPFIINQDREAPVIAHQLPTAQAKPSAPPAAEAPSPIVTAEPMSVEKVTQLMPVEKAIPPKPVEAAPVSTESEGQDVLQEVVDYYRQYAKEQEKALVAENNAVIGELMAQYQEEQAEQEADYLALCQFAENYYASSQVINQSSTDNYINDF